MVKERSITPAMNLAGTFCGCAALLYLLTRTVFSGLARLILSFRIPGATLANPAGASLLEAAVLRMIVSALALASPFLLLYLHPLSSGVSLRRGRYEYIPRLFLLFWAAMMAGNFSAKLLLRWEGGQVSRIHLPASGAALIASWLAVCLLPAFGEELLFRGLLQGWLRKYGAICAILGQAVLFSLLHGQLSACAAALLGGLALGICAEVTGSLRVSILFHLYNNTLAFFSQYALQYLSPTAEGLVSLLFSLGPPIAALIPALKKQPPCTPSANENGLWLLRCPGWLLSAAFLLAVSLTQSYF